MVSRKDFSYHRDKDHSKYPILPLIFFSVFKLNTNPGPGAYESLSPRIPGPSIKKDINPNATMMSRVPLKKQPGPTDYKIDVTFNDMQSTFLDTKKPTNRGNKFSASKRTVFDAKHAAYTPGPGQYIANSSFGQYMDKSAAFSALQMINTRHSFTHSA